MDSDHSPAPELNRSEAHDALDNLPNKVLATEYKTVLSDQKVIAEELERSPRKLDERSMTEG